MKIYSAVNERGQYVHIFLLPEWFNPAQCARLVTKPKYRRFFVKAIKQNLAQAEKRKWSKKEAVQGINVITYNSQFSVDYDDKAVAYIVTQDDNGDDVVDMYTNVKRVH